MGLLSNRSVGENLESLERVISLVFENWDKFVLGQAGYSATVGKKSLSRIVLLGDTIFDGITFEKSPGPFKRAAAACVLLRMFVQISFKPQGEAEAMSVEEENAWRARFSLATVPVILDHMVTVLDGKEVELRKPWTPSTLHVQVELLNWLRWLERPIAATTGAGVDQVIDLSRLQRTVLALAMTIENSYYLIDAKTDCDVMHHASSCIAEILDNPILFQDLTLFSEIERVPPGSHRDVGQSN